MHWQPYQGLSSLEKLEQNLHVEGKKSESDADEIPTDPSVALGGSRRDWRDWAWVASIREEGCFRRPHDVCRLKRTESSHIV